MHTQFSWSLLPLVLLAACELQPAPQQSAAPAKTVAEAPPAPPPPSPNRPLPSGPPADAGAGSAAPPAMEVSDECVKTGVHVVDVLVAAASDPGQRANLEQARARSIRSLAEVCTQQAWSAETMACYLGTKTPAELKTCEAKFTPPPPPTPKATDAPPVGRPGAKPAKPAAKPAPPAAKPAKPARPKPAPPAAKPAAKPAQPKPARPAPTAGSGARR